MNQIDWFLIVGGAAGGAVIFGIWDIALRLRELKAEQTRTNKLLKHLCWRAGANAGELYPWQERDF